MVPQIRRLVEIFITYFGVLCLKSNSDNTILCIRVCICMILVQSSNFFCMIFLLLTVNISCLMRYYLCFLLNNALSLVAAYCIIMMVKFMYNLLSMSYFYANKCVSLPE
jgi:hypothetical protein